MLPDWLTKNELNDKWNEEFISGEEKSMIFSYWFAISYIRCELDRILEEHYCNGICLFCKIIIGIFGSWCNTFARLGVFGGWCGASAGLTAKLANDRAIVRATGETNCGTADRAISGAIGGTVRRAVNRATGRTIGETNHEAAGGATDRIAGRIAERAVDRAAGRVTCETNCEAISGATSGVAGGTTGRTVDRAVGKAINETHCRAADRATGGAVGRVWTNVMIILSNLSAYTPKLEKQNRQSGSSSFCSCLTNVIWKATFASHYFQVIGNLRLASPLFD